MVVYGIIHYRFNVEPVRLGGSQHSIVRLDMSNDIVFTPTIKGLSDGGYEQAKLHGFTKSLIRSMMALIPGLGSVPKAISDENREELRKGYALRWNEENPTRYFVAADGNWVECESEEKMLSHKKSEKFTLNVHTAFSYTTQAFGALRTEEPQKHELVGEVRTKFNKYVSNRISDLEKYAAKIYKEDNGIEQTRTPVAEFNEWLFGGGKLVQPGKSQFEIMRQRCINAKSKGSDATADLVKLDKAIAAFKTAWSK
jgi:hypothetical protein